MHRYIKIITFLLFFSIGQAMAATEPASPTVYTEDKPAAIIVPTHPVFSIKLKSNPTTGYSWFLRSYDTHLLEPVKHVFEAPENKKLLGAPGYEVWTFKVKPEAFTVPHQTFIRLVYGRPWEANSQAKQMVFQVTIQTTAE